MRLVHVLRIGPFGLLAVAGATLLTVQATSLARAFPDDQVARGEQVWNDACVRCHGPNSDNPDAPLLDKPDAFRRYATAAALHEYVAGSMPDDQPSSLPPEQYWDVLAYLLKQKGVMSEQPLGPETAGGVPTKAP